MTVNEPGKGAADDERVEGAGLIGVDRKEASFRLHTQRSQCGAKQQP